MFLTTASEKAYVGSFVGKSANIVDRAIMTKPFGAGKAAHNFGSIGIRLRRPRRILDGRRGISLSRNSHLHDRRDQQQQRASRGVKHHVRAVLNGTADMYEYQQRFECTYPYTNGSEHVLDGADGQSTRSTPLLLARTRGLHCCAARRTVLTSSKRWQS